jgi:hypothetical protein
MRQATPRLVANFEWSLETLPHGRLKAGHQPGVLYLGTVSAQGTAVTSALKKTPDKVYFHDIGWSGETGRCAGLLFRDSFASHSRSECVTYGSREAA